MDSGTKVFVFFHFDSRKHIIIFMKADGNCRITMDYRRNLFGGPRFYVVTESAVKIRKNNRVGCFSWSENLYQKRASEIRKLSRWGVWRGWHCKPLRLPSGFSGTAPEKNWVLMFSHCLKWVFQHVFSSFNNAFRFNLMTSKWDQERLRLAIYPSWMSSGWGRVKYLNHKWKYCQVYWLMRKFKTRIIRQYTFLQTLYQ